MAEITVKRFTRKQRFQITLIAAIGSAVVWLIGYTLRFRVEDREHLDRYRSQEKPVILSFWHNQILAATYFFRFQGIVVITSRHFDGEYIGRIIERFGYGTARGSSSRGAIRALLELRRHLGAGRDVAFTIDGPRGPVYRVKPGPLFLSRKVGAPIVPFHIEPKSYWQLNSWDQFRIPRPFTSAVVKFGRPIETTAEEDLGHATERYQEEMDRIKEYGASYWRRP